MVCCERRVVEPPPMQIVPVPLLDGELGRQFHPVPLGLEVSMHWRRLHPCVRVRTATCSRAHNHIPEYGPRPTAQRNRKATISRMGRASHCEALDRRGCTNDASGNGSAGTGRLICFFLLPPFGFWGVWAAGVGTVGVRTEGIAILGCRRVRCWNQVRRLARKAPA